MDPRGSSRQGAREQTHPCRRRRRRRRHGCADDEDLGGSASDRRPGHHRRSGPRQHGQAVDMGKSSRPGAQRTDNDPVADWLAGIPTHEPNAASIPRGHASNRHDRGRNENPSPRNADSKTGPWDPRHARRQTHSRSPRPGCVPPKSRPRHHHVKRHSSSDCTSRGSLSGVGQSSARRPLGTRSASMSDETLSSELTPRVDAPPPCSLSFDGASPSLAYVPRRPRHRVRHDKYEPKRAKRERSKPRDDLPPEKPRKSRKTDRKHALTSSKNVMNNWKSEAVLNDRITVQQPLKPGLFKNGREANLDPVQDLAFSPMNFLRVSKEKTHPKSLSEKRLRELERQQQEMEEESRFFAANKEADTTQNPAFHRKDRPSNDTTQGMLNGRSAPTEEYKARHISRSSPSCSKPAPDKLGSDDQPSTSPRHPSPHNTVCVGGQQSSRASRAPTYISWSSSPSRSPPPLGDVISRSPSPKRVRRTASPGASDRAMMKTGIFRGTRMRDRQLKNSEERTAGAIGESDHFSSNEYPGIRESLTPASSSVSTPRGRRRRRHRADPLFDTKATQYTQSRERDRSPHEPRQPGRRMAKRPHSGPPELKSSERARVADVPNSKKEWPRHEACTVSKSEARSHEARAARLEMRSKKRYKKHTTANGEADYSRMLPGGDYKRKGPDSNERESPRSRDAMPPPPVPATKPYILQKDTTSREYPGVGNAVRPDSEEEMLVGAYERAERGLGEMDAGMVVAEEDDTSEHSQNRKIRAGGVILPLQSVSWIDPASRPATPSLTYNNTPASRATTRPVSFAAAPVNAPENDGRVTEPAAPRQEEESIVEFIMRIESEAEAGMPELRRPDANPFGDEDTISVDTAEGQQTHYEACGIQRLNVLGEESWDPNMLRAQGSEAYVGNVAEPYTPSWEDAPEEQDLSFTWDPHQYRRY